jgi:outer membrane protein assembly factor BamA
VAIAELVIDGLPADLTAEALAPQLANTKGAVFDRTKEKADHALIVTLLHDLGYLDADVKPSNTFVPGGIRLTWAVKPHALITLETVQVPGMPKDALQGLLDELKLDKDTPCTRATSERIAEAAATRLSVNPLFIDAVWKIGGSRKTATLVLTR